MRQGIKMVVCGALLLIPAAAVAQTPPPRSPQDAACRQEASDHVSDAPNPRNLDLETLGRQIWTACMRRSGALRSGAGSARHAYR
jgi:hypothetical protein